MARELSPRSREMLHTIEGMGYRAGIGMGRGVWIATAKRDRDGQFHMANAESEDDAVAASRSWCSCSRARHSGSGVSQAGDPHSEGHRPSKGPRGDEAGKRKSRIWWPKQIGIITCRGYRESHGLGSSHRALWPLLSD